jgi:hypothetical protein
MNMYMTSPCIPLNPKSLVLTANWTVSSHVSTGDKLNKFLISFLEMLDLGLTYIEYICTYIYVYTYIYIHAYIYIYI